jgi:hypothetical protein
MALKNGSLKGDIGCKTTYDILFEDIWASVLS